MRTFIAIDLTPEIKKELYYLVSNLKPAAMNIKWVASENYHLTLKFIGETTEEGVERIKSALDELVKKHRQFPLTIKGTGSFPPGQSRLRVVWVGVSAGPEFRALQADLEELLRKKNFSTEDRPFSPHLTIGRARSPQKQERLKAELDKLSQKEVGLMQVKEITFFQSVLHPEGPEYKVISQHYLQ
jgi:2'-5' RNA ligase